ncbi:unnamed protein product [Heligmosomoides polygyrus]|uniref:Secreted protein n=1 Tax=Heligmosomoides polygyrus TaxID=6339 RepID=A0A183FP98_HELPZ|nr:unnamed protein product [Heligmosomoides polygyrus]
MPGELVFRRQAIVVVVVALLTSPSLRRFSIVQATATPPPAAAAAIRRHHSIHTIRGRLATVIVVVDAVFGEDRLSSLESPVYPLSPTASHHSSLFARGTTDEWEGRQTATTSGGGLRTALRQTPVRWPNEPPFIALSHHIPYRMGTLFWFEAHSWPHGFRRKLSKPLERMFAL